MMKRKAKWLVGVLLMLGTLAAGVYYFPWNATIEGKIKSAMESAGLSDVSLRVAAFSTNHIAIDKIAFSKKPAVVSVGEFKLEGDSFTAFAGDAGWSGTWSMKDGEVAGLPLPVLSLAGNGDISFSQQKLAVNGKLASMDNTYMAEFSVSYVDPENAQLTLKNAVFPWNGGVIALANQKIPLSGKKPIHLTLQIKEVSLDALMQMLTSGRASATGNVSGTLPLTISPDGVVVPGEAVLKTSDKGQITLQPDAIPGGNPQVDLLRSLLANFQYQVLSISTSGGKDDKLSILLSLEGNNPEVYNGRSVKLNVNLTGDVLRMITQAIELTK